MQYQNLVWGCFILYLNPLGRPLWLGRRWEWGAPSAGMRLVLRGLACLGLQDAFLGLHPWPVSWHLPTPLRNTPSLVDSALARSLLQSGWWSQLRMPVVFKVYFRKAGGFCRCLFVYLFVLARISPTSHYAQWCPGGGLIWFLPFQRKESQLLLNSLFLLFFLFLEKKLSKILRQVWKITFVFSYSFF